MTKTQLNTNQVEGLTDVDFAAANIDGTAATPSLRTLGTGSQQACAGNDSRLSNARTPLGTALTTGKIWQGVAGVAAEADPSTLPASLVSSRPAASVTVGNNQNYICCGPLILDSGIVIDLSGEDAVLDVL